VTACKDFDLLLPLHASGALEPADASRVEAHLATCAACRAEAVADRDMLELAKLPPAGDAERRALADGPRRVLAELRRNERRRSSGRQVLTGVLVAAAALLAVLAPAAMRHRPGVEVPPAETAAATPSWDEPDLDTLWDDAGLVVIDGAVDAGITGSDAAVAALEF
jgi:anti-sigma factor RsiW